jgi:hypothetical protein
MIQASFFRSLILNSFLFISVFASHHLAGGGVVLSSPILLLFLFSLLIFWKKPIVEFEGPGLAAVLIIFQLLGHILMEQSSEVSSIQMLLAHFTAAILTYKFAHKLDYLARHYLELLLELLLPIPSEIIVVRQDEKHLINAEIELFKTDSIPFLILGRAPPIPLTLNNY